MLDQIKKYAPKTAESLSKIIVARENSVTKIIDYEQQIKDLDEQIMTLESESCKNPNNSKTNEKLETLSAKRFGLHFRFEALKNGSSVLFSKDDLDKITSIYKTEYIESLANTLNQNSLKYRKLRSDFDAQVKALEEKLDKDMQTLNVQDAEIHRVVSAISQTLTKNYLQIGLSLDEILKITLKYGIPFDKSTDKAI